jgi:hypothetical protein
MSCLTVLAAPASGRAKELTHWIRRISQGAAQLAQEAAGDPDPDVELLIALAWLVVDLAAISEAAADFMDFGACEINEAANGFERIDEMRRLLRVGSGVFGDSTAHTLLAASIAERIDRESREPEGEA